MDVVDNRGVAVNLGGEGEIGSSKTTLIVDVNLPHILESGVRASRNGKSVLDGIRRASNAVVIARGDNLPFKAGAADRVLASSVPIGDHRTWLGPAYSPNEIRRISKAKSKSQIAA